jgi:hypothetical protein
MTGGENIAFLIQFNLHIWRRRNTGGLQKMEEASCLLPGVYHS